MIKTNVVSLWKDEEGFKWTMYCMLNGNHREITVDYSTFEDGNILDKYDFFEVDISGHGYYDVATIVRKDDEQIDILVSRRMFYRGEFI